MKSINFAIIGLCIVGASAAQADAGLYAGLDVSQIRYTESTVKPKTIAVLGKAGYQFNDYLAVEGRAGGGVSEDTVNDGGPIHVETGALYGVYVKGMLPVAQIASLYALGGYTHGKVTSNDGSGDITSSKGGGSYGVGAQISLTKQFAMNVEWAHLYKGDGLKVRGLTLGASYKF